MKEKIVTNVENVLKLAVVGGFMWCLLKMVQTPMTMICFTALGVTFIVCETIKARK
jgi:hypothetical protein